MNLQIFGPASTQIFGPASTPYVRPSSGATPYTEGSDQMDEQPEANTLVAIDQHHNQHTRQEQRHDRRDDVVQMKANKISVEPCQDQCNARKKKREHQKPQGKRMNRKRLQGKPIRHERAGLSETVCFNAMIVPLDSLYSRSSLTRWVGTAYFFIANVNFASAVPEAFTVT